MVSPTENCTITRLDRYQSVMVKKKGTSSSEDVPFVRAKGLESIRLSAPDPKSGLATNYNTPAELINPLPGQTDCKGKSFLPIFQIIFRKSLSDFPESYTAPVVDGIVSRIFQSGSLGCCTYHRHIFHVESACKQQPVFSDTA